jgi:hypothetical protein
MATSTASSNEPHAGARRRSAAAATRVRRHLDAVWQGETSVRTAVRDAYEQNRQTLDDYIGTVDYRMRMIEGEVELAEAFLAVELASDAPEFAEAADAALAASGLYIERLQARAAVHSGSARADGEEAIRELRRRDGVLALRLAEFRAEPADGWPETKAPVCAAIAELESGLDEMSTVFD